MISLRRWPLGAGPGSLSSECVDGTWGGRAWPVCQLAPGVPSATACGLAPRTARACPAPTPVWHPDVSDPCQPWGAGSPWPAHFPGPGVPGLRGARARSPVPSLPRGHRPPPPPLQYASLEAKLCQVESKYLILLQEMQAPVCAEEQGPAREVIAQLLADALQVEGPEQPEQALVKPRLVRSGGPRLGGARGGGQQRIHGLPGTLPLIGCASRARPDLRASAASSLLASGELWPEFRPIACPRCLCEFTHSAQSVRASVGALWPPSHAVRRLQSRRSWLLARWECLVLSPRARRTCAHVQLPFVDQGREAFF